MVVKSLADPKELISRHLSALRGYARLVLLQEETLSLSAQEDKAFRMRELTGIATAFRCSEKDMVKLLYKGLFQEERGCECFSCRLRRSAN